MNLIKPDKVRRACKSASETKKYVKNAIDWQGMIYSTTQCYEKPRFFEGLIDMTAAIKSIFLRMQVPERVKSSYGVQQLWNILNNMKIAWRAWRQECQILFTFCSRTNGTK